MAERWNRNPEVMSSRSPAHVRLTKRWILAQIFLFCHFVQKPLSIASTIHMAISVLQG